VYMRVQHFVSTSWFYVVPVLEVVCLCTSTSDPPTLDAFPKKFSSKGTHERARADKARTSGHQVKCHAKPWSTVSSCKLITEQGYLRFLRTGRWKEAVQRQTAAGVQLAPKNLHQFMHKLGVQDDSSRH